MAPSSGENFGGRCGITQLGVRELLVASHILPWSDHPEERLNVRNGICLSRLHDAAFDCHLISFDENLVDSPARGGIQQEETEREQQVMHGGRFYWREERGGHELPEFARTGEVRGRRV